MAPINPWFVTANSSVRLWLDDLRPIPPDYNQWAKTAQEAISAVDSGNVAHISFDHDLGPSGSGYDVAKHIEAGAHAGTIKPMTWDIHSQNAPGSHNIRLAMEQADKFWLDKNVEACFVYLRTSWVRFAADFFMATQNQVLKDLLGRGVINEKDLPDIILNKQMGGKLLRDIVEQGMRDNRSVEDMAEQYLELIEAQQPVPVGLVKAFRDNLVGLKTISKLKPAFTAEELAKKWDVSVEEINKALNKGQAIEHEHTTSDDEARTIASQHVFEQKNYYDLLEKYVETKDEPKPDQKETTSSMHQHRNTIIGCAGFSHPNWQGTFYPKDTKANEKLLYYARHIQAVEINCTEHFIPRKDVFARWAAQTPKEFVFSFRITANKSLQDNLGLLYDRVISTIGPERLGVITFVIPPNRPYGPG